jgi:predicted nuclease of restriction endonuclease-like (RecB) superfamily
MGKLTSAKTLFKKISQIIETSRRNVYTTVNTEIVLMYWHIGEAIKTDILGNEKAEYGKAVIEELSQSLSVGYGRGFSERNLFNMLKLYEVFSDEPILHTLCAKLSWSHIRKLMYIQDDIQRDFYTTMAINERWSVRTLNERINSMLFERTLISKKPEKTITGELKKLRGNTELSADLFFRDPYPDEEKPIAIILCAQKDDEVVELLELEKSSIHVGRYYTELPPKSIWQDKLRKAVANAKHLIEQRNPDN